MSKPNRMRRFVQRAQETARHERAIQQETERSDQSFGRKQKQPSPIQAGQRSYRPESTIVMTGSVTGIEGNKYLQISAGLFHDEGQRSRVHPLVGHPSG